MKPDLDKISGHPQIWIGTKVRLADIDIPSECKIIWRPGGWVPVLRSNYLDPHKIVFWDGQHPYVVIQEGERKATIPSELAT